MGDLISQAGELLSQAVPELLYRASKNGWDGEKSPLEDGGFHGMKLLGKICVLAGSGDNSNQKPHVRSRKD